MSVKILKMNRTILIIFIFIITVFTIEWFKLYINLAVKRNVNVVDVAKLRFDSYLRDFNKTYNKEDYKKKFQNFKKSLKDIARLNMLENNTVFGLTKFSDMSKKEFADRMLLKPFTIPKCQNRSRNCIDSRTNYEPFINKTFGFNIPSSFDWRNHPGVVKPVLNQEFCEGCWAFSIVGVLESMSAIQFNDTKRRSIQELLDCSPGTNGCYGGNVVTAMNYICTNKTQFVTEEEYPIILSMEKNCHLSKNGYSGRMVKGFQHICRMDEGLMVEKIATHGPLVVAVDSSNWRNYLGGVIRRACTRGVSNHVVQIVGYEIPKKTDAETPIPYYIVRNSYGEDFGDHGYVKIAMKYGKVSNVCGIAEQVTLMEVY